VYSYRDPATLAAIAAATVGRRHAPSGICLEPPGQARQFLRYAPEFVDDPDGTGLFRGLGAAVYTSPPAFLAAFEDAAVIGYRTLLHGREFLNDELYGAGAADFLNKLRSADAFLNEETGLSGTDADGRFVLGNPERPTLHLADVTAVLCSTEPSNYGSFIFRVLPKLHALRAAGLAELPVLVYANHPAKRALLELCGIPAERIVRHDTGRITTIARAVVPSLRNPNALLDHESRALFRALRYQFGAANGNRRLYISRIGHGDATKSGRRMLNEPELARALASLGFEIVEPERLTAQQQIEAFSGASLVVGPAGSAMFNAVFCRPGTKLIDIESEPHWMYAHAGLFASSELRYGIFVGRVDDADASPVHRRWTVNIAALLRRVGEFAVA
jgi:hypothetical protein